MLDRKIWIVKVVILSSLLLAGSMYTDWYGTDTSFSTVLSMPTILV